MPKSRAYCIIITISDDKQIKDILLEFNKQECACIPVSAAISSDAMTNLPFKYKILLFLNKMFFWPTLYLYSMYPHKNAYETWN